MRQSTSAEDASRLERLRFRWLADLLLHEVVHLALNQRNVPGRDENKGHGKVFTDEVNRVGALMGLPKVRVKRPKGPEFRTLLIASEWPHNLRPGGEFGEPAKCPPGVEPYYGDLWERIEVAAEPPATVLEKLIDLYGLVASGDDRAAFRRHFKLVEVDVEATVHEPPPAPP